MAELHVSNEQLMFLKNLQKNVNELPSQSAHPFIWTLTQKDSEPAIWETHEYWTVNSDKPEFVFKGTNCPKDINALLDLIEKTYGIRKRDFVARNSNRNPITMSDEVYKEELEDALEAFDVGDIAWFLDIEYNVKINYAYWRFVNKPVEGAVFISLAEAQKFVDDHPEINGAEIVCARVVPGTAMERLIQLIANLKLQEESE